MASMTACGRSCAGSATRFRIACAAVGLLMLLLAPLAGAQQVVPQLYRVFLKDGTPIISYGEYTRTGDRVVFTVPLGAGSSSSAFQIVSLPESVVDWDRTAKYSDMLRFQHYAATRGDTDYTALTADVARALGEMAATRDGQQKLAIAHRMRLAIVEWPRTHYGYRSRDVRDLASVIDEMISAVQADLGQRHFQIDLVAMVEPPPGQPLPEPTLHATLESAFAAARHSDQPVERLALQQVILSVLSADVPDIPDDRRAALRSSIRADIRRVRRESRAYAELTSNAIATATRRAAAGSVAGIEDLLDDVQRRDAQLGHRRPDEMLALKATLSSFLDAARVRRLELDRWLYRNEAFASYKDGAGAILQRLSALTPDLEAVRAMSGPEPARWPRLLTRLTDARGRLVLLGAPDELQAAHETLSASVSLMEEALRQRREAVLHADTQRAHNASAAAAGSLLLLERARSGITAFFSKPGLP
jgi:hypothetical protein